MIQAHTTISNKLGLHARASAKLTKLASSFPCEVWITKGERGSGFVEVAEILLARSLAAPLD